MRRKTFADILNESSSDLAARMAAKVPEWTGVQGLEYPSRLAVEQCSSSAAARYKASLAARILSGRGAATPVILDLTGGLGVDCWAFSKIASHVHHNEMDGVLSAAVEHNFKVLGAGNTSFSRVEVTPGTMGSVISACPFPPDLVYLDPARRDQTGRKVFLLEDCSPDLLSLKDELLQVCPDILAKLSPMADISKVAARIGECVREIHVVGTAGECKELLVWMHRGWGNEHEIIAGGIRFDTSEESEAIADYPETGLALEPGTFLFEPSPVLHKAGCFKLLCQRLNLLKAGKSTHLYFCKSGPEGLGKYGKVFVIKEIHHFCNASITDIGSRYPGCGASARNLPVSSDELMRRLRAVSRKKAPVPEGTGAMHIFAFTADFSSAPSERLIAVTERIL